MSKAILRRDVVIRVPLALAAALSRSSDVDARAVPGGASAKAGVGGAPSAGVGMGSQGPRASDIRRSFTDTPDGQLHTRVVLRARETARVPVVCLHETPLSGRIFERWLVELGASRDVLAPDLPGYGDSDGPTAPPSIGAFAWAIGQLIDSLGLREVDLLAVGVGALVAVDLAVERAAFVRRLVLTSIPFPTPGELDGRRNALRPPVFDAAGAHWGRVWAEEAARRGAEPRPEDVVAALADRAASGAREWWGLRAAFDYPTAERLSRVTQPVRVLRTAGEWAAASERAVRLMPAAAFFDAPPDVSFAALEHPSPSLVEAVRLFFDA